jgi:hypothetical protein
VAGFDGMNGYFAGQLNAMFAAAAAAGHNVYLTSGFRDPGKQQQLWAAALDKYGDPEVADNWVARPGTSNHEKGVAGDLGFGNQAAREWVHQHAAQFGLHFPMSWEPWHIEPLGQVQNAHPGAYTTPPPGHASPKDNPYAEDPHDPGVQFRRLIGIMNGSVTGMAGPEAFMSPDSLPSPSDEFEAVAAAVAMENPAAAMVAEPEDPNADPNDPNNQRQEVA